MRYFTFLIVFCGMLYGCAQIESNPFSLDGSITEGNDSDITNSEEICAITPCQTGYHCEVRENLPVCLETRTPEIVVPCDNPCLEGEECFFQRCIQSDPRGEICEFHDTCLNRYICVNGRCTYLEMGSETCDGLDNDADGLIDENEIGGPLVRSCYSGPPGTVGIGECQEGFQLCRDGQYEENCREEIIPSEEEGLFLCNGRDDNCDGISERGSITEVDIVFAFDISGSMQDDFVAVIEAIRATGALYNTPDVLIGLIVFPGPRGSTGERRAPFPLIPMSFYPDFLFYLSLSFLDSSSGGEEASWDIPQWIEESRLPGIQYRPSAKKVMILFTDEQGQSYLEPANDEDSFCSSVRRQDIELYTFVDDSITFSERQEDGTYVPHPMSENFDDCSTIFNLSIVSSQMVDNLRELADSICE